ncbi:MAG: NAD(P)H-dependent oxidoreductase subunit E [Ignavibacteria bacterium]|nr:NAD(P)H-dependent oxidoreductase subunit E [Ignavibacteria bacterium]
MFEHIKNHLFDEKELKVVENHLKKFPSKKSATLPLLWMMQDKYGYVSQEAMTYIAELLEVPSDHVLGVVTFYTMYFQKPTGKIHMQVCTNVSCMLRGGYDIFHYLSDKLKIKNKEKTHDGLFSIEEVECLGSCGTAPMLQVNNKEFYENLSVEKMDDLLEELKNKYGNLEYAKY